MEPDRVITNIEAIIKRIAKACYRANRNPEEVKLLLATKTVTAVRIKSALSAGYILIGENKVQEIKEKYEDLKEMEHTMHFIGHLQTNKIREIIKYGVQCIQSLDKLDTANKLQQRLEAEDKTIEVLIQVNTSGEESKFGVHADRTVSFIKEVAKLDRINIKGLMTIGLFSTETERVRSCFRLLKAVQQQAIAENIQQVEMKELSMGMSNDLEVAIEEGATIVRVGTAVFGERVYPDSYYWNEKSK